MLGLVAALALCAPPPPAAKAAELREAKAWDELYLAFAAAAPATYPRAEQRAIAAALSAGCQALLESDAVMAFSLGDRAVAFAPSADAVLCAAKSAVKTEQRGAALEFLERGTAASKQDTRLALELGRLTLEDRDAPRAIRVLSAIPRSSPQAKEARALLEEARRLGSEEAGARAEAASQARALERHQVAAGGGGAARPMPVERELSSRGGSPTYESSTDGEGRRVRQNGSFRFRYFNGQRDFGQRADYEGTVQAALEEARLASRRFLGRARESAVDVILYSRAEFTLHHGPQAAAAIAGFYSQNAIRMNDSAQLDARQRATLVHEYVHAVIDEAAGFNDGPVPIWLHEGLAEYTSWQYQGHDGPPLGVKDRLRAAASTGALPSLSSLARGPLIHGADPALTYAESAVAVKLLLQRGGPQELFALLAELGGGVPFEKAFAERYGRESARLDDELVDELKRK